MDAAAAAEMEQAAAMVAQVRQATGIRHEQMASKRIERLCRARGLASLADASLDDLAAVCEATREHVRYAEEWLTGDHVLVPDQDSICGGRFRYLGLNNEGLPVVLQDWMWGEFLNYPGGEDVLLRASARFVRRISMRIAAERDGNPPEFVSISTGGPPPLGFIRAVSSMRIVEFPERVSRICFYGVQTDSARGQMIGDFVSSLITRSPAMSAIHFCGTAPELFQAADIEPGLVPDDVLLHSKPPAERIKSVTSQRIELLSAPEVTRWTQSQREMMDQDKDGVVGIKHTFVDIRSAPEKAQASRRSTSVPRRSKEGDSVSHDTAQLSSESSSWKRVAYAQLPHETDMHEVASAAADAKSLLGRCRTNSAGTDWEQPRGRMSEPGHEVLHERSSETASNSASASAMAEVAQAAWFPQDAFIAQGPAFGMPPFWGPPGAFAPQTFGFVPHTPTPLGYRGGCGAAEEVGGTEAEELEARALQLEYYAKQLAQAARFARDRDVRGPRGGKGRQGYHGGPDAFDDGRRRWNGQQEYRRPQQHQQQHQQHMRQQQQHQQLQQQYQQGGARPRVSAPGWEAAPGDPQGASSSSDPYSFPTGARCVRQVQEKTPESDEVWRKQTLGAHLAELRDHDPTCIFIVRRLGSLGFQSRDHLLAHYSQFGEVTQVLVPHSKAIRDRNAKAQHLRIRPGSFGFVVMGTPELCSMILGIGRDQEVAGQQVTVEPFRRVAQSRADGGSGEEEGS